MKNKMNNLFCEISNAVLLSGLILAVLSGIARVIAWRVERG